jgi:uncharacterized membrane protein YgcG
MDPNLLNQLAGLLAAQQQGRAGQMAAPLPMAFGAQPQGMPAPTSVLIPIKVPVGQGSVKVLLSFGPEFAEPNAMMALLNALANAGLPVDIWVPKQQFGSGFGGGGGGGWRGNGGGGGGFGGGSRWGR